ncbi:MAG: PIN domain-containing protein, partial [Caldilineaceae bacterium]|nr:PIN domain-containing protein [Caldilineaceae bacterium]
LLDTNVLIRFLREDHEEHSPAAQGLFLEALSGECVLILTDVAVSEAVWVLLSVYKIDRRQIAEELQFVAKSPGVRCVNRNELLDALDRFAITRFDILDCYLDAMAAASGDHVATFDNDFVRFTDVLRWDHGV